MCGNWFWNNRWKFKEKNNRHRSYQWRHASARDHPVSTCKIVNIVIVPTSLATSILVLHYKLIKGIFKIEHLKEDVPLATGLTPYLDTCWLFDTTVCISQYKQTNVSYILWFAHASCMHKPHHVMIAVVHICVVVENEDNCVTLA